MIDKIDVKIKCEFCKKEILPINWERHQNTKTCREHCFEKCGKIACFHFEGNSSETHRLYCGVHKLDNMVDVTHPTCKHEKCKTRANFNYEGETKGLYCGVHGIKLGMVNVVSPTCKHEKCKTQPTFNYEGETKGLYCGVHGIKLGMVNVKERRTCKHEKCETRAHFNYEGETKGLYCGVHGIKLGMVNVVSPTCKHEKCKTRATFNYEGETKGLYCSKHGIELGMVDVKHPRCKLGCGTLCTKKYRGYCFRCFIRTFPDEPVSRNYKTKELYVADFVKNNFHDKTIICDKVISGGCSRRRPDIMIDFGYQILIVEVDEGQHDLYKTTCEDQRINDIYTDLGDRPIVLIRFNPDGYKTKNGNITSCWGPNKRGITVVKKSKKKEWEQRLSELKEKITYWCHKESNEPLITEYLFFDKKK